MFCIIIDCKLCMKYLVLAFFLLKKHKNFDKPPKKIILNSFWFQFFLNISKTAKDDENFIDPFFVDLISFYKKGPTKIPLSLSDFEIFIKNSSLEFFFFLLGRVLLNFLCHFHCLKLNINVRYVFFCNFIDS